MPEAESKIQNPRTRIRAAELVFLLAAAAFLLWSRSLNFSAPLDPDEANYGFIGARLVAGDRMYVDVWDQQPPLTFLIFGWLREICGPAEATFRGFAAACSVVTLLCVYLVLRRPFGKFPALAAAATWALVSHDPGTDGDQANREIYMNTCAVAALLCLSRAAERSRGATQPRSRDGPAAQGPAGASRPPLPDGILWLLILAGGLLLALGTVFKIILALLWFAVLPWLAWQVRLGSRAGGGIGGAVALFALGPLLVWLGHAAYFAADGRFTLFFDAVIRHNLGYAGGDVRSTGPGWSAFLTAEPWVFVPTLPLWIAGAVGFFIGPWKHPLAWLIRLYAVATLLEIVLPGKFWRHYYHLLLPPLTLLTGLGIARIAGPGALQPAPTVRRVSAGICLVLLLGFLVPRQYFWYYARSAEERSFMRYVITATWPRVIGLTAGRHSGPGDTLYMHGDAVGVYYYADRRPLTKYTMASQFLLDEYAGAAERRRDVAAVITSARRARFVFLMAPPFPELSSLLQREYGVICEHGPLLVFAHRSVPPADIPPPEAWVWEPADPELVARCNALNERYRIWRPPPRAGD